MGSLKNSNFVQRIESIKPTKSFLVKWRFKNFHGLQGFEAKVLGIVCGMDHRVYRVRRGEMDDFNF